ncbi:Fc.00g105470.m01.CDS01 [Cosmosporella sp. VM-42]
MLSGMPKVVDVAISTEGGPFGPVTGGFVVLHGPLFRISAQKEVQQIKNGAWFPDFTIPSTDNVIIWEGRGQKFTLDSWIGRVDTWENSRDMYCALVGEDEDGCDAAFGLLLERVEGLERGIYRRIGSTLFSLDGSEGLFQAVKEQGKEIPGKEDYLEFDLETGNSTYEVI